MQLTPDQLRAVQTRSRLLFVNAGPGSGKTRVIVERIKHLVNSGVPADKILAITFTNKAAKVMQERLASDNIRGVTSSTMHSLAVRLMIRDREEFSIYDEDDCKGIIKRLAKIKKITDKDELYEISEEIALLKDNQISAVSCASKHRNIYLEYENELHTNRAVDFADLINSLVGKTRNGIVPWQHILVDEAQDLSNGQIIVVRNLYERLQTIDGATVTLVGDLDQCFITGQNIDTPNGSIKIDDCKIGDNIYTLKNSLRHITKITNISSKKSFRSYYTITTSSGRTIKITDNHSLPTSYRDNNKWVTYLMYRHDKGYRVGISSMNDIQTRLNGEKAHKAWILEVFNTKEDACYLEETITLKYGVTQKTFVIHTKTQFDYKKIFQSEFKHNGEKVLNDYDLSFEKPLFVTKCTRQKGRVVLHVQMNPSKYSTQTSCESLELKDYKEGHLNFKERCYKKKQNNFNHRGFHSEYKLAFQKLKKEQLNLSESGLTVDIIEKVNDFIITTASQVFINSKILICNTDGLKSELVTSISYKNEEILTFDLEVAETGLILSNGIVSHNSVYEWRNAKPQLIRNFVEKEAEIIPLAINFRSTRAVVHYSKKLIAKNKNRIEKPLESHNTEFGPTPKTQWFYDSVEEADYVVNLCKKSNNICILYRSNWMSAQIELALQRANVKYTISDTIRFLDRKEIKDVLSYIRIAVNSNDMVSLTRSIQTPKRGIGRKALEKVKKFEDIVDNEKMQDYVSLIYNLRERKADAEVAVRHLLLKSSYLGNDEPERIRNLDQLTTLLSGKTLEDAMFELTGGSPTSEGDGDSRVHLMTLHSCKGTEYDKVIMIGCEEGITPHINSENLEEERRLFYVGMTRAEQELIFTYTRKRLMFGNYIYQSPTRFLKEIGIAI